MATGLRAPCRGTAKGSVPEPTPPHAGGGLGAPRFLQQPQRRRRCPAIGSPGRPQTSGRSRLPRAALQLRAEPGTLTGQEELAGGPPAQSRYRLGYVLAQGLLTS